MIGMDFSKKAKVFSSYGIAVYELGLISLRGIISIIIFLAVTRDIIRMAC
jgi:hypothetical protein